MINGIFNADSSSQLLLDFDLTIFLRPPYCGARIVPKNRLAQSVRQKPVFPHRITAVFLQRAPSRFHLSKWNS